MTELYDLTPLLEAIIGLVIMICARYFVPWLKSKLGQQKYNVTIEIVRMLVMAAEQLYKGSGRGEAKLQFVEAELAARGYKIDRAAIEAMVKELYNTEAK